jgi:hypothetical protein
MTKRIQRKRTKGWRMPKGAVYVGRPSKWGNPFQEQSPESVGGPTIRPAWGKAPNKSGGRQFDPHDLLETSPDMLVAMFVWNITLWRVHEPAAFEKWIAPLRGKDLTCWCPSGTPCHADVLLRLARRKPAVTDERPRRPYDYQETPAGRP